ncbi:MAG TPA: nitroreductase family deazaflavin-dependent oxidoreductase [Anaerolineae bacterium]|nr:nitroreductase family deazaflavin-dependent oxidoreductase [Anaerolineae bacterium]
MAKNKFLNSVGNPFVRALLRSPLHDFLSDDMIVITYTDRKSGKKFSAPVNFQQEGKSLRIVSQRDRNWWWNIRGGATVRVLIKGQEKDGWAELIEEKTRVAEEINKNLRKDPRYARFFNIRLNESGEISKEELVKIAGSWVVVLIQLSK